MNTRTVSAKEQKGVHVAELHNADNYAVIRTTAIVRNKDKSYTVMLDEVPGQKEAEPTQETSAVMISAASVSSDPNAPAEIMILPLAAAPSAKRNFGVTLIPVRAADHRQRLGESTGWT